MSGEADGGSERQVRTVVVLGGGSAGWIAAARIAARNGRGPDAVRIVLVESPSVPTIGVGEGTWPTMRNTLRKIGLSETTLIRECDAALKQGARFVGWTDGTAQDGYYHPLNPPVGAGEINLSPHWEDAAGGRSFAATVDFQATLCDAGLAPKSIIMPEYGGAANYAYHLDAGKFATVLRDHAVGVLGVEHVLGDMTGVRLHPDGDVAGIELKDAGVLGGDLFVDCTGFRALLIGGVYDVPFRPCRDVLFNDRALAIQVPYAQEDASITCHTVSTAQDAGWIWDIGLYSRRGTGYVYSTAHTSDDEAEATLRRYLGSAADGCASRRITIDPGHRQRFWVRNCVAVGLSAGFLEPLEASALMLIEKAVDAIADRLPRTRAAMEVIARQFDAAFLHHWDRIIEFLKLHYVLTKRADTDYWRDNVDPATIPDGLQERLGLWRDHPPAASDFDHASEVFNWPSYQYILHGMGFDTQYRHLPGIAAERNVARRWFEQAARLRERTLADLPRHRDLLTKIRTHGLQTV